MNEGAEEGEELICVERRRLVVGGVTVAHGERAMWS